MNSSMLPNTRRLKLQKAATAARGSNLWYAYPWRSLGKRLVKNVGAQIAEELRNYFETAESTYTPKNTGVWNAIKNFFAKLWKTINPANLIYRTNK